MRHLYPVIHQLTQETSLSEATIAYEAGVDGVFLISHGGSDHDLIEPAQIIKQRYPTMKVGINCLGMSAQDALETAISAKLDMVWVDDCGVRSDSISSFVEPLIKMHNLYPIDLFGSVAFKYQKEDSNPAEAARRAADFGMIPTTSGSGTGSAPEVEKIKSMQLGLSGNETKVLALASGMTPDNIDLFLPWATHFLVSTGISKDFYHLDKTLLTNMVLKIKNYKN